MPLEASGRTYLSPLQLQRPVQERLMSVADTQHVSAGITLPVLVAPEGFGTHVPCLLKRVRDEDRGRAAGKDLAHFRLALFAEDPVADGDHLVQDQDVGLDKAGGGKGEASHRASAAGFSCYRCVDYQDQVVLRFSDITIYTTLHDIFWAEGINYMHIVHLFHYVYNRPVRHCS